MGGQARPVTHRPAVVARLAEPPEQVARAHGGGDLSRTLPGVPLDWCEGVALLATQTAPPMILPRRWAKMAKCWTFQPALSGCAGS